MCVCVCAIAKKKLPGRLETSSQRVYRLYWHNSRHLECIVHNEKLAGGGSVAGAVGVSDR